MKTFTSILIFVIAIYTNAQVSDFNNINFTKADNTAKLNKGESLYNLPLLTHKLTFNLKTDVEKFRAIYYWVCNNISGDYNMHSKVNSKQKKYRNDSIAFISWSKKIRKKAYRSLLKNKKTMCTGYAHLIKEMAKMANIECKIIDGYARDISPKIKTSGMPNHSWNAVKLNNKWYLCDATWSSGYMLGRGIFVKSYNDGYFLTEPLLFSKRHLPLDKKWLLKKEANTSSFLKSPLLYSEAYKYKILPQNPSEMNFTVKKNEEIHFTFKTLKDITSSEISLIYFVGKIEKKYKISDLKKEKNSISFKNKFKNRGFYDIHLKIDNDIVITYTLEVLKS